MATYTDSYGFDRNSAGYPAFGLNRVTRFEIELDFAEIAAARLAAGATALAALDVLQVLNVPAKTFVMLSGYDVLTAEGATATMTVGDGNDPDGLITSVNLNSVASGVQGLVLAEAAPNTVAGYTNGKYYAAADTIDVVLGHNDIATAKVKLWFLAVDCN